MNFNNIDYISGELFMKICDLIIYTKKDYNKYKNIRESCKEIILDGENIELKVDKIHKSKIFFVKSDCLNYFQNIILPIINNNFILITHNSAKMVGLHKKIIDNKYLIKWYGQNMLKSLKTQGIPLGLPNTNWNNCNYTECIKNYRKEKTELMYFNFTLKTHKTRKNIENILLNNGFKKNKKKPWNKYLEDLSKHIFCASPRGAGFDCIRIWESIYVGTIPIVKKDKVLYQNFKDLPILWVDNFYIITESFLLKQINNFKNINIEKSKFSYWYNLIKEKSNEL
jgi:hypothetical protein